MTDQLLRRTAFLVEIACRKVQVKGRLGKTAMQKLLYLLQEGAGVKLGYRFNLYTYGPYESAVMRDIDYAASTELLSVTYEGDRGYRIEPGPKAGTFTRYREEIRQEADQSLDRLFKEFGEMNASDLELRATLLFIVKDNPKLIDNQVIDVAKKVKPKFDTGAIQAAFKHIKLVGLVDKVREDLPLKTRPKEVHPSTKNGPGSLR